MRTPLERLLGEVPNYTFFKVFGFASWPHLRPYNELRLEKEQGVSEEVGICLVPRRRFKYPRHNLGDHIVFTIKFVYGLLYVNVY
jgi:hypothetical protein